MTGDGSLLHKGGCNDEGNCYKWQPSNGKGAYCFDTYSFHPWNDGCRIRGRAILRKTS